MARLTRPRTPPPDATTARLPGDARLLKLTIAAGLLGAAISLVAALAWWLARAPLFNLKAVDVQGELTRGQLPALRAQVLPEITGNFFSLDLRAAQRTFEAMPWVRRAVVRRIWPDRLAVQLEEHVALALWEATEGSQSGFTRLVNRHGEVFEANLADVEDEALPLFMGPEGRAAEMLALWQRLQPAFAGRGQRIETLTLSGRGSWRAELGKGVVVELGRGGEDEVVERTERFLRTVGQLTQRYKAPLIYADLRHADGYALKLRGVSTTPAASSAAGGRGN
jgi:cell division protein FtsQ